MKYNASINDIEKEIAEKLKEIEEKNNVRILHAVESGSRAWGFASPDSDYDVRFIYVALSARHYLQLEDKKDFINWELNEVLDINGWDLDKTLKLFHKSNATLFEWANSPVIYRTTDEWQKIYAKAKQYFSKKAAMYHYYGTAKSNYHKYLTSDYVNYKKYFYVIRPLLACQWVEEKSCPPPVLFEELKEFMIDRNMAKQIDELQELKVKMNESEKGKKIEEINTYIERELIRLENEIPKMVDDRKGEWDSLNQIFIDAL